MGAERSNPYFVSVLQQPTEKSYRRPVFCTVAACIHMTGYSMLVLIGILFLFIVPFGGLAGARSDEVALAILAISALPIAGWLVLTEIRCLRVSTVRRERLLSRLAMAGTVMPGLMSVFWWYEYAAFGHYQLNAVPAMWMAGVTLLWLMTAWHRHLRVPPSQASDSPSADPVPS